MTMATNYMIYVHTYTPVDIYLDVIPLSCPKKKASTTLHPGGRGFVQTFQTESSTYIYTDIPRTHVHTYGPCKRGEAGMGVTSTEKETHETAAVLQSCFSDTNRTVAAFCV